MPKLYEALAEAFLAEGVDTQFVRDRIKSQGGDEALANIQPGQLMRPESVANAYWDLYRQPRDAWTFEHEIRPFGERW